MEMFFGPLLMIHIRVSDVFVLGEYFLMLMTSSIKSVLTVKLSNKAIDIIHFIKLF